MKLDRVVAASSTVAGTRSRKAKRDALAECLVGLGPEDAVVGVCYLSGALPQGRVGVGPGLLRACESVPVADSPTLELRDVDHAVRAFVAAKGKGAAAVRRECLRSLFRRASAAERDFLIRLFVGELRQGALQGVMVEAIAKAWSVAPSEVRRAHMLCGDIAEVSGVAAAEGEGGLRRIRLRLGRPIQSMLAKTAENIDDAFGSFAADAGATDAGERAPVVVFDVKMDGARVQVHKEGNDVAVYSRRLNDVSASVPEVVEAVRRLPVRRLLLDGEATAIAKDGRPLPFQVTMRRFGRRLDVAAMRAELPLVVYFFDCLHADGADLLAQPCTERLRQLDLAVPPEERMPRCVTALPKEASGFLAEAMRSGHEGVMAKHPASVYEAGARGGSWLKIKHSHTLDLLVLAAEWGNGRRRGFLSNLHLGARDPATGGFAMLGKTFKGLTDALLKWQTRALLDLETGRAGHVVYVEPKLVVEIAFNDVQISSQYPSGVALRFARVKRYREDKEAAQADTIDAVRALLP